MERAVTSVVYVISKASYEQVSVSLASLIDYYKGNSLDISFLYDDPEINLNCISDITKQFNHNNININLHFYNVRTVPEYTVFESGYPKEVYFRLLMPSLIDCHQALYIDGDTMVQSDLSELLTTPLSDSQWLLGAHQMVCMYDYAKIIKEEGKTRDHYISSGICLINLDEARKSNYVKRAVTLYQNGLYYISSIVNYLGYDGMEFLPVKYHVGKELINPDWRHRVTAFYPEDEVNQALEHPAIIHYSGAYKPNSGNTEYFIKEWEAYWRQIFER